MGLGPRPEGRRIGASVAGWGRVTVLVWAESLRDVNGAC